jgi:hypothetical protein
LLFLDTLMILDDKKKTKKPNPFATDFTPNIRVMTEEERAAFGLSNLSFLNRNSDDEKKDRARMNKYFEAVWSPR